MMSSALLCGIVPESISDSNATPSNDSDVISVAESPSDATPSNGPSDDDGVNAFNMIRTPSSKKVRVATSGKKRKLGKAIRSDTEKADKAKAGKATESQKKKKERQKGARQSKSGQSGQRNRYSQIPKLHLSFETGLTNSNLGVMTRKLRKSGRFSKAVGNAKSNQIKAKVFGKTKSFGTCGYAVRGWT